MEKKCNSIFLCIDSIRRSFLVFVVWFNGERRKEHKGYNRDECSLDLLGSGTLVSTLGLHAIYDGLWDLEVAS